MDFLRLKKLTQLSWEHHNECINICIIIKNRTGRSSYLFKKITLTALIILENINPNATLLPEVKKAVIKREGSFNLKCFS